MAVAAVEPEKRFIEAPPGNLADCTCGATSPHTVLSFLLENNELNKVMNELLLLSNDYEYKYQMFSWYKKIGQTGVFSSV